ncbi:hypothetical protein [Streptomyces buecherae]|uniref:Uncharacterized protein n=1 Tax=Streptomyces buecherae TaxID=2763006 RepID=A0A7H8N3C8_9ACTN|nr:hypothetical protein [Streptomyces buecherae]QKW48889.1 hypothetical protein HUT08_04285 [Streptomyces buecherae]
MTGWRYDVWVCGTDHAESSDHDGSCGIWERKGIHWNGKWFDAFEEAALRGHALVEAIPVGLEGGWKHHTVFEHVRGGGLCKGCWDKHGNTHAEHILEGSAGHCRPCTDVQKRRGPLTRTPNGQVFMCEDCRTAFLRHHEERARGERRDPDARLYRPVLDVAREDAGA